MLPLPTVDALLFNELDGLVSGFCGRRFAGDQRFGRLVNIQ